MKNTRNTNTKVVVKKREPGQKIAKFDLYDIDRNIPGVVYGKGKENLVFTVTYRDIMPWLASKETLEKSITLSLLDKDYQVKLQAVQRDPVHNSIIHVDMKFC